MNASKCLKQIRQIRTDLVTNVNFATVALLWTNKGIVRIKLKILYSKHLCGSNVVQKQLKQNLREKNLSYF